MSIIKNTGIEEMVSMVPAIPLYPQERQRYWEKAMKI